jgi:hypothetical protein
VRVARWSALLRLGVEFAVVFAAALLAKQVLATTVTASYPNILWFPVVLLALAHGVAAGLAAAVIATALQYLGGLPPASMVDDMYAYIARISAEPVGWTCAALLIGHVRSRQIASSTQLQEQLGESTQRCAALAELCDQLRQRTDFLERQMAAHAYSSNADLAEAMSGLHHAGWDDFVQRLTHFVVLMTACTEFKLFFLRDGSLEIALAPGDAYRGSDDMSVVVTDPLFAAVIDERRVVSERNGAGRAVLAGRAIMAGPLVDGESPGRVVGMLTIGGPSLADCPEDIDRRFVLTCTELSRLAGRIHLMQRWHMAAAGNSKGHTRSSETLGELDTCADVEGLLPSRQAERQISLQ